MNRLCPVVLVLCTLVLVLLTCGYSVAVSTTTTASGCNSTLICSTNGKKEKQVLYILAMAPYPTEDPLHDPSWPGGPAVIPGVLLAIEHINCNSSILPDYRLEVIISDGGCQWTTRAFANLTSNVYLNQSITSDHNVVGIVGGGCSESALVVAKHVTRDPLSLVQISPSATSPVFVTDIDLYKNTVRLTTNAFRFKNVFMDIILNNGYSEVAMLYDFQRRYMLEVSSAFVKALNDVNVTVTMNGPILEHFVEKPLEKLRGHNRLIFVFAGRDLANEVLCLAFIKGMLYPDYQLIFINRRVDNFLKDVNVTHPLTREVLAQCSEQEMAQASLTATIFEPRLAREKNDRNTVTVSGYTYNEIDCQYSQALKKHTQSLKNKTVIETEYHNAYYDSTWALAMSLHNSQPEVNLSSYKYGQPRNTEVILDRLFNLSFEGAVGKVQFSRNTFDTQEVSVVNIYQQRVVDNNSIESLVVASYSYEKGQDDTFQNAKFVNSSVFNKEPIIIHPPIELGWAVIAVTIIVFIVIGLLHFINWTWADAKHVKATSPQLNNLIFSGCYLLLLGVLSYTLFSVFLIETSTPDPLNRIWFSVMCNVQLWVFTYAVSLIFGTICMKTWRIWRIFSHFSSTPLRFAGDVILVGFVVVLITIDTVYLTVWISVNPLQLFLVGSETSKIATCGSVDETTVWAVVLVCYKLLLIGFALFLSVKTRKISKLEFKQTKSINALIYIQLFNFTLGIAPYAIVTKSLKSNEEAVITAYVLYCVSLILATIFCIIFVFLPPIYPLIQKKLYYHL